MIAVGLAEPTQTMAAHLASLHGRAFAATGRGWSATEIATLATADGAMLVVEKSARPKGFALFRQVLDEAELLTVCVDPDHWNKGVAQALLSCGCSRLVARECSVLFLEVAETNRAAWRLYDRHGFEPVGYRKDYYGPNGLHRAVIMRRRL